MRSLRRQLLIAGTVTVVLFASGAGVRAEVPDPSDRIDEIFAGWNRTDQPGAAVAVVRDGDIVFQNAYGMADLERGVALTTQSVFEIGSISKQFTAMCVLLLEHDGKLTLDDDIRATIPEMPVYDEPITIRHLLHHTSGIRDIETLVPLAGIPWVNYQSPADQLELIARQKELNFPPNSRFLYSNSGYLLLGLIVERVSGRSLKDFAEERIFEPLGMLHTVFWDDPKQIVANRAIAYSSDDEGNWGMEMWNMPFAGPAGLYSTLGDLALWDANFYDNQLGGGSDLIDRMETSGVLDSGEETGYASGLDLGTRWNLPRVRHGGAWMGYRAYMTRFPEQHLSMIFLSNAASIDVSTSEITRLFLEDVLDDADAGAVAFEPPETVTLSAETLASFEGDYWAESAGLLRTIEVKDGALHYLRGEGNATELAALKPGSFIMTNLDVRVDVLFKTVDDKLEDSDTPASMTVLIEGGEELVFTAVTPPTGTELSDAAGDYWSEELQRELSLRTDNNRLLVSWADEKDPTPAVAIDADHFLVRQFVPVPWSPMDATLRAKRDGAGRIVGLTFDCEMVSGIAFVKRGV